MNKTNLEEYIPYIVKLKDSYCLEGTTIRKEFCGFLVNNSDGNFYFELNGSRMLVIVPRSKIEFMAPSKRHFDLFAKGEC